MRFSQTKKWFTVGFLEIKKRSDHHSAQRDPVGDKKRVPSTSDAHVNVNCNTNSRNSDRDLEMNASSDSNWNSKFNSISHATSIAERS